MGEFKFADNYNDLSRETGVNAGFQFEFYCERCGDTWRTPFVAYRSGQASGWLGKVSDVLGGALAGVGDTIDGLAQAGWGKARDEAFQQAVDQATRHFHRCARCYQYVCEKCWNDENGLCMNCAPSAEAEVEASLAQAKAAGASEKAALEGKSRGGKIDVKKKRQLVCPQCGEETGGAKFCSSCGFKLAVEAKCGSCGAVVPAKAKFCPECGAAVG